MRLEEDVRPLSHRAEAFIQDPEARRRPYEFLADLQRVDPMHRTASGTWLVLRYDDVRALLADRRLSVDQRKRPRPRRLAQSDTVNRYLVHMMSMQDPPDHDRIAGVVRRGFTRRVAANMRHRIESVVDRMLEPGLDAGRLDVIGDLGQDLPVNVTCALLSIEEEEWLRFQSWTSLLTSQINRFDQDDLTLYAVEAAVEEFADRIRGLLAERRRRPLNDDLLSGVVAAYDGGADLDEMELVSLCMLILMAGRETVTNMIGNSVLTLLSHPDQLERLRRDPVLVPSALEECLRYESPIRLAARWVPEPFCFGGEEFQSGDTVLLVLAAANRDPGQFADPQRFDVGRVDAERHLAFGHGTHFCTGYAFARIEGAIVLERLLRRCRGLEPAFDLERPPWSDSLPFRGLRSLPVRFIPERVERNP